MELYELTRKLVARGCPEHPDLVAQPKYDRWCYGEMYDPDTSCFLFGINNRDARAIWTMWALEWWRSIKDGDDYLLTHKDGGWSEGYATHDGIWDGDSQPSLLEAIGAATRHLEPK